MYRETEDPSKSTEPTMALARRDLSSKRAHTTSEVSTSKECASGDRVQGGVTLPARPMSTSPSPAAHAAAHARAATADDAACSRDLEEVVAARLQTCSALVCMTHVRTAARSPCSNEDCGAVRPILPSAPPRARGAARDRTTGLAYPLLHVIRPAPISHHPTGWREFPQQPGRGRH